MPPNDLHASAASENTETAIAGVKAEETSSKEDVKDVEEIHQTIEDAELLCNGKTKTALASGKEMSEMKHRTGFGGKETVDLPTGEAAGVFKPEYVPKYVYMYCYVQLASLYALYTLSSVRWETIALGVFMYMVGMVGLTAGKHRLWTHRAYKARLPLRLMLAVMCCIDFQYSITTWVRDHRMHHKFCETDADPYNPTRGLFFAHCGWFLQKKHPEVRRRGQGLDMTDIHQDPILSFQHKHFILCGGLACFVMPAVVPALWGESLILAWHVNLLRFNLCQHVVSLVNSAAHTIGCQPYDTNITATQVVPVSILSMGEGYHNYHHAFPSDYRTAELGNNTINFTTMFIDFFAKIGWAYDRKTMNENVVKERQKRVGDGTDLWGRTIEWDKLSS